MELSNESILKDIAEFSERITAAKSKLAALSAGYLPYPEHKKRETKRDDLLDDIKHVENLIKIAKEAIEIE